MSDVIRRLFPRLEPERFEVTSPRDRRYNCVAWAAGDAERWWWPGEPPFSYWPAGIRRDESIDSFIAAFVSLGYSVVASAGYEEGFEKVAIFAAPDGVPTHVARQLANGSWTSKLGQLEDISHVDVSGVGGSDYGEPVAFLRHPLPGKL